MGGGGGTHRGRGAGGPGITVAVARWPRCHGGRGHSQFCLPPPPQKISGFLIKNSSAAQGGGRGTATPGGIRGQWVPAHPPRHRGGGGNATRGCPQYLALSPPHPVALVSRRCHLGAGGGDAVSSFRGCWGVTVSPSGTGCVLLGGGVTRRDEVSPTGTWCHPLGRGVTRGESRCCPLGPCWWPRCHPRGWGHPAVSPGAAVAAVASHPSLPGSG